MFLCALSTAGSAAAQEVTSPIITAPTTGQLLQGQVAITGTTDIPNFAFAEVAFGYPADPTNTWFSIQTTSQPTSNGTLATWDTSGITDGDYVIRLRVTVQDGRPQDTTVAVRVRNYTIEPTPTSTATPNSSILEIPTPILAVPSETLTPVPPPPPTALPPNPAAITTTQIYTEFVRGVLAIAGLFIVIGILLRLRKRE